RLLSGIDINESVNDRNSYAVIIGVALALDRLAGLIAGEFERAGAQYILLVPMRVLIEDLLFVDPRKGIGEGGQKGAGGKLQTERNGRRVGRFDLVDHHVKALARAGDACGRLDDLVPARCHVGSRQRCTIMEFDALTNLEGVGLSV